MIRAVLRNKKFPVAVFQAARAISLVTLCIALLPRTASAQYYFPNPVLPSLTVIPAAPVMAPVGTVDPLTEALNNLAATEAYQAATISYLSNQIMQTVQQTTQQNLSQPVTPASVTNSLSTLSGGNFKIPVFTNFLSLTQDEYAAILGDPNCTGYASTATGQSLNNQSVSGTMNVDATATDMTWNFSDSYGNTIVGSENTPTDATYYWNPTLTAINTEMGGGSARAASLTGVGAGTTNMLAYQYTLYGAGKIGITSLPSYSTYAQTQLYDYGWYNAVNNYYVTNNVAASAQTLPSGPLQALSMTNNTITGLGDLTADGANPVSQAAIDQAYRAGSINITLPGEISAKSNMIPSFGTSWGTLQILGAQNAVSVLGNETVLQQLGLLVANSASGTTDNATQNGNPLSVIVTSPSSSASALPKYLSAGGYTGAAVSFHEYTWAGLDTIQAAINNSNPGLAGSNNTDTLASLYAIGCSNGGPSMASIAKAAFVTQQPVLQKAFDGQAFEVWAESNEVNPNVPAAQGNSALAARLVNDWNVPISEANSVASTIQKSSTNQYVNTSFLNASTALVNSGATVFGPKK